MNRIRTMQLTLVASWIVGCATLPFAAPAPTRVQPLTDLPVRLYEVPVGTAAVLEFVVPPAARDVPEAYLFLRIDDLDKREEGTLRLEGHGPLEWPETLLGEGVHSGMIRLPPTALARERMSFRFRLDSDLGGTTGGYIIEAAELVLYTVPRAQRAAAFRAAADPYRRAVLETPGLVAYLSLDEADGTLTPDRVGDADGHLLNADPGRPGVVGKALGFGLDGSALVLPGSVLAAKLAGAPGLSVEFWIAAGGAVALPQDIMTLRGRDDYGSVIHYDGARLSAFVRSETEFFGAISVPLEPRRYAHVVAFADFAAGTMGLAVNGTVHTETRQFAQPTANYGNVTVATTFGAGNTDLVRPFAGQLDEIAIYRGALDEATIRHHFELGREQAALVELPATDPWLGKRIEPERRLSFGPISSFCDWCHSYKVPFTTAGIQTIVERHRAAGVRRIVWRCTDGGTTAYFSKLREPFHGLQPDNCHVDFFLTPNLEKYEKTDFRQLDSLAELLVAARAAEPQMEVYAWVQISGEDDCWGYASRRVQQHPEFCTIGRDGKRFRAKLAWSMPENHEYLLGLLREIMAYEPDGVILDFLKNQGDYRDQLTDTDGVALYGYEAPAVNAFRQRTGRDPFTIANDDQDWIQFRADRVTEFCRKARALQRAEAPDVRWLAQIWGGGDTNHFIPIPDSKPGERRYRIVPYPVRDALAGQLCDIRAWSREGLFDAIYPLISGDLEAFRTHMSSVRDLIAGGRAELAAGAYVWGKAKGIPTLAHVAVTEFGVRELFLAESLTFEPNDWVYMRISQELYGR